MNDKVCEGGIRCPVEACLSIIGGKWKGVILYNLLDGTKRFNELRRKMPTVTQRMLTKQLRDLEAHEIISRTIYQEVPPKVEYSLTEFGMTLEPIIKMLQQWGMEHFEKIISLEKIKNASTPHERFENKTTGYTLASK